MIAGTEGPPPSPPETHPATSHPPATRSSAPPTSFRALAGSLTPIDEAQASRYLAEAYRSVTGRAPSAASLDLLWAQWALETARGQAMYGNNFAGIKAGQHGPGAVFSTTEGHGAGQRRIRDRFRTYGTPEEGARDYVALLARRYPSAFEALRQGDLDAFSAGLHRGRYFTAHPDTYRSGLERLRLEHRAGLGERPVSPTQSLALDGLRWALEKAAERE